MLDTIAINLQRYDFTIHRPENFTPHADAVKNPLFGTGGMVRCYCNPSKEEKAQGYLPRLTLYKVPYGPHSESVWLKIEFSAPKLIFGNNFEELEGNKDFERVVSVLLAALERMGVTTTREALVKAKISAIHYSKNIILDRGSPCHMLIQTLEKADMNARLDMSQTDFRNGGQMVKYHSALYEIVMYDKMKDLEHVKKFGEKRGAESDYGCQLDLFNSEICPKPEVLRLEIRLKSGKLKGLLKTLKIKKEMNLAALFCDRVSRGVLLHYWDMLTQSLYIINIEVKSCEKIIDKIRTQFPSKRQNTVLALMGFIIACQEMGVKGARLHLGLNNAQFYRLKADAKKLEQDTKCPRFRALSAIRTQLKDFVPLLRGDIAPKN